MANIHGVTHVAPPTVAPAVAGIFSVADLVAPGNTQELMGVVYETESCFDVNAVTNTADSCIATDAKTTDGVDWIYGNPFPIYAGFECGLFDNADFDEGVTKAKRRLELGRERAIEQRLWDTTFAELGVNLTPVGGAVSPAAGLAILEEYAGLHYNGQPIVHMGKRLATSFAGKGLLAPVTGKLGFTTTGSRLVLGNGYTSLDGPDLQHADIAAPVLTKGAAAGGGTFAAGDYFWKITAIVADGGETTGSNEVTATLTANQQQALNWAAVTGATGYKVYRGTAAGAENRLVTTLGAVTTYTDTGTAGTAATVPTENTTDYVTPIAAGATERWLYITGEIVLRGSEVEAHPGAHPQTNELIALAEQIIVPTVDCLVAAIRITLES